MIEMRWLKKKEPNYEALRKDNVSPFGFDVDYCDDRYVIETKILQMRTEEGPRGEQWWGDWIDVPIEEDKG